MQLCSGRQRLCGLQRLGCFILQVNGDKDLTVRIGVVLLDHKHRSLAPGQEAGRRAAQQRALHRARTRTQYQKARLVGDTKDFLDHDADEHLRANPAIGSIQRSGVLSQVGLDRRYPTPAFRGTGPVVPRHQQRRLDDMHDTQEGAVLIGQLRSTPNRGGGSGGEIGEREDCLDASNRSSLVYSHSRIRGGLDHACNRMRHSASMSVFLVILLPMLGSAVGSLLPTHARNAGSMLAAIVALAGAVQMALLFPLVRGGGVIREEVIWLPSLGINLVARVDGFAWTFSMLVLVIGLLVVLYSRYYMSSADPMPRFYSSFLGFMGAMLGIVLSGNLIQMVFFWELTSLFSFVLIGYWNHRADARRGARMALIVTGAGGLCLLSGVLLIGRIVGSYDLDAVLAAGAVVRGHALYPAALVLVLLGAMTKSAQFPFHFWLPHAMAAPTTVSAYLHSATMVRPGSS